MSAENVELVRWLQPPPDIDLTQLFHRDADPVGVQTWITAMENVLTDDFVCSFHALGKNERQGAAGLREIWLDWLEPWESYRAGVEDLIDAGAGRVVVLTRDHACPRGLSAEVDFLGAPIWTVRDGKIARIEFYFNRAEGLEAAGLTLGQ